jgi:hypothetical protein
VGNEVDAWVHEQEVPASAAAVDCAGVNARGEQLAARHMTRLARREPGVGVGWLFCAGLASHTDVNPARFGCAP